MEFLDGEVLAGFPLHGRMDGPDRSHAQDGADFVVIKINSWHGT
jgi:hypothetical protein